MIKVLFAFQSPLIVQASAFPPICSTSHSLDSLNLSSKALASFAAQSKHPVRADMAQENTANGCIEIDKRKQYGSLSKALRACA